MTHIRIALALLGAAVLLAPSPGHAGPTVKKRAWQTLGFTLESTRLGAWGPGYGERDVTLPACPAGEAFVITAMRVAPERARLHAPLSWSESRLAGIGAWQVGLGTFGPDGTYLKVPVNGAGASDASVELAGGVAGSADGGGAPAVSLTAIFRPAAPDAPDVPPLEGLRFRITLTGACGTASMTALP